jgi:hypothetical protein
MLHFSCVACVIFVLRYSAHILQLVSFVGIAWILCRWHWWLCLHFFQRSTLTLAWIQSSYALTTKGKCNYVNLNHTSQYICVKFMLVSFQLFVSIGVFWEIELQKILVNCWSNCCQLQTCRFTFLFQKHAHFLWVELVYGWVISPLGITLILILFFL